VPDSEAVFTTPAELVMQQVGRLLENVSGRLLRAWRGNLKVKCCYCYQCLSTAAGGDIEQIEKIQK